MIFITVGSQKFQFNRLLKEIDKLIENGNINEEVVAQIGVSDYLPKNYKYYDFLTREQFQNFMKKSDLVITHAGTGAIITALKNDKKVIAIPRLSKFGEHVDDHQIQLIDEFKELNSIEAVYDIEDLKEAIGIVKNKKYNKYISNTDNIIEDLILFLEEKI